MGTKRLARVNELLKREVADELYRVMNEGGFDLSAVTVTRVTTSPDLRHARVSVSIRGSQDQRRRMLSDLQRHRKTIQHLINKNVRLKYTPRLAFELDESIEAGDRILRIIDNMEIEQLETLQSHETPTEDDER